MRFPSLARVAIVYLLVAVQLPFAPYAWAVPLPPGMETMRMGIVRLGREGDSRVEMAYPLLEKRVQRWLENLDALPATVEPLGLSVPAEVVRRDARAGRLRALTEQLVSRLSAQGAGGKEEGETITPVLVDRMREERQLVGQPMRFGPEVQKSLVAEAAFLWRGNQREAAMRLVKRASLLHPLGRVETMTHWDERSPGFELAVQKMSRRSGMGARGCLLNLEVVPRNAKVQVNGFAMSGDRRFSFPVAVPYFIAVSAEGFRPVEKVFQCERVAQKEWKVSLVARSDGPGPLGTSPDLLSGIRRRNGVTSLLLIEAVRDEFRLYFYSSDAELAEIPLRQRIRVADVLRDPGASGLPVVSDAFLSLVQKHDGRSLGMSGVGGPGLSAVDGRSEMTSEASSHWYNKWYFWAIAGGVAGGAAILYFTSRNQKQVQSRGGIFLRLE